MRISKIKITNLFGIKELELDGKSIEVSGTNGLGKSSILDAIRYALKNSSERDFIVRNGETEGEIFIETDTGLTIDRKKRLNSSDYKSIKNNGKDVSSPESFLKEIFTEMQLSPTEFINMSKQEQNRAILDLIEFNWDINWIKEKFGEIPEGVDYSQNILQVLNDIQAENGFYYQTRQNINREKRNKLAFIEDIAKDIPENYNAEKWEKFDLTSKLKELMQIKEDNNKIEEAKMFISNYDNKIKGYEAEKQISIAAEEKNIQIEKENLQKNIERMKAEIKASEEKLKNLQTNLENKKEIINLTFEKKVAALDESIKRAKEYANKNITDITSLTEECNLAEEMKKHLNEYNRMEEMKKEVDYLDEQAKIYDSKIELARNLPAEILKTATLPIENLSVHNGLALVNGIPVSGLSEGEKLMLCIDVTLAKEKNLKLILLDGVEKLSEANRKKVYEKCHNAGLQFIATRTDNNNELLITEV